MTRGIRFSICWTLAAVVASVTLGVSAAAAQASSALPPAAAGAKAPAIPEGVVAPEDYVVGPGDVLSIVYWREKDLSAEVTVRPDGKISLPLLNDMAASGLTPEQLRVKINDAAERFVEVPTVSVVVKQINSRRVFITGQVNKPGSYTLAAPTTVLQLIAMAGGVLEYADTENVAIMRIDNGRPSAFRFNYNDVARRKNLQHDGGHH